MHNTFKDQVSKFTPFIGSVIGLKNTPFLSHISQHDYHVHYSFDALSSFLIVVAKQIIGEEVH